MNKIILLLTTLLLLGADVAVQLQVSPVGDDAHDIACGDMHKPMLINPIQNVCLLYTSYDSNAKVEMVRKGEAG